VGSFASFVSSFGSRVVAPLSSHPCRRNPLSPLYLDLSDAIRLAPIDDLAVRHVLPLGTLRDLEVD
jgi:hypothetical protein